MQNIFETLLPITTFSTVGRVVLFLLCGIAVLLGSVAMVNFVRPRPALQRSAGVLLQAMVGVFLLGFFWICWFHYQIFVNISLELPAAAVEWLNRRLAASGGLPLYDIASPPRYAIPVWIENEKYYFWFMCTTLLAFMAHRREEHIRFRAALHLVVAIQVLILFFVADPFSEPLPRFFAELAPWFVAPSTGGARMGLFMQLYPKMIYYYNAEYMWLHPPMLFISYGGITITFVVSLFMLVRREPPLERLGYDAAKMAFFMLTVGMLLGYPWALKAWGPNWWWDPKICSSLMMWAVFSTYLHARLYANKIGMWYFSSFLGILCFLAMIFTFLTSFFFPGEHTFQ